MQIDDTQADALPTAILPGDGVMRALSQDSPAEHAPASVRALIAGFLSLNDGWDGIVCAEDGGVRFWVHVSADEAVSMQGFLTPGLTADLGGADAPLSEAIEATLSRPERLAAQLRTAQVAQDSGAITGHLLGAELAAARVYWLGQQVAVISDHSSPLTLALQAQSVMFLLF